MSDIVQDEQLPTLPELLASSSKDTLPPSSLTSSEASSYIARLTTLSLDELEAEPTELASSSAQLTNALTTLCYNSYPTFLSLHATTSTLSSSFDALSSSLSSLLSSLPNLESRARTFAQDSRTLLASRRKAALVLEHHDKLHDVLSLPLLLETSVRNHNYADALLLAQHASTLAARFPSNPLIQSVKADCDARVHSMLAQLLRVLHEQAKLPALFRAVGFLRKMNVLSEEELALAFLAGRSAYLDGTLRAVEVEKKGLGGEGSVEREREIHSRYLKRYVDAWREGVHDVVTQYTTIFLDRAHNAEPAPPELHVLLTTFTTLRVRQILDLLRDTLPLVADPSLLSSLLTQLTYCATSFARVGMDFRAALGPLFTSAVQRGVTREFEDATDSWLKTLESENPSKGRSRAGSSRKKPSQLFLSSSSAAPPIPTPAQLSAIASAAPNVPPPILASYPPLALYTNALLSAMNGLRLLAPASLLHDLLLSLEAGLTRGANALLTYARGTAEYRSNGATTASAEERKREEDIVRAVGTVYAKVFVPFLRRALVEGVYGIKEAESEGELGIHSAPSRRYSGSICPSDDLYLDIRRSIPIPHVRTSMSPDSVMHRRRRTRRPSDAGSTGSGVSYKTDSEDSTVVDSSDEEREIEDDGHIGPRSPVRVYKVPAAFRTGRTAGSSSSSVSSGNTPWRGGASSSASRGGRKREREREGSRGLQRERASAKGQPAMGSFAKSRGSPVHDIQAPSLLHEQLPIIRAEFPGDRIEIGYRKQAESTIRWGYRCLDCPGQPIISAGNVGLCVSNIKAHLLSTKHVDARSASSTSSTSYLTSGLNSGSMRHFTPQLPAAGPSSLEDGQVASTARVPASNISRTYRQPVPSAAKADSHWECAKDEPDAVEIFLKDLGLSADLAGILRRAGITDRVRMQGLGRLDGSILDNFQRKLEEAGLDWTESALVRGGLQKCAATTVASKT
ncbi:Dor1-domain-containing protein [Pilatotrama ljubarskyi]|nr:Dor1-domain-containing protein [Pilatotrama ljubarskyi]